MTREDWSRIARKAFTRGMMQLFRFAAQKAREAQS